MHLSGISAWLRDDGSALKCWPGSRTAEGNTAGAKRQSGRLRRRRAAVSPRAKEQKA